MHREITDHEDVRVINKENDQTRTYLLERRHRAKQDRLESTISRNP